MMSETVNPANGSLSLRIQVPMPKGRGLTLPFSFAYDSNGAYGSLIGVSGEGEFLNNPTFLSQYGWSYSVPLLSANEFQMTEGNYSCPAIIDYVFQDPSGSRHALYLASVYSQQGTCGGGLSKITGGDDLVQAALPGCVNTGYTNALCYPVAIADADGLTYLYSSPVTHQTIGTMGASLPYQVEDRNGNELAFTDNGGGNFYVADTLGRIVLCSSGFGSSGNTVYIDSTLSGSVCTSPPLSYTVNWTTTSYNVPTNYTPAAGGYCRGMANEQGTNVPAIGTITLPNSQVYSFSYDSTYGLINAIYYPTGAVVTYTWGLNPQSERASFADSQGNKNGCTYTYDAAAITDRYVYSNGQTLALHQHFAYSTLWNGASWTKTTTVTTYDTLRGGSFQTVYSYTPVTITSQPYDFTLFANQIPVESEVDYCDWGVSGCSSSNSVRSVYKSWVDQYEMQGQQVVDSGTVISDQFFVFGPGAQITDKYECASGHTCYNATQTSPPTAYARHTQTVYQSFAATPIYTAGPSIFDRIASIYVFDGSGNKWSDTYYNYDGGTLTGPSATNHDNANYGTANNSNRGNATQMTKWVNTGSGTSLSWSYTYDDTGQLLTMTDPKGNETRYSYTDEFPACSSPGPPGNTNAYLTQTVDAKGFTQNFTYRYCDGQLNTAQDRNSQTTSHTYDSLGRLTVIAYPDGGSTSYGYANSGVCPQPSSTTIALGGGLSYQESAAMDGLCHVTQTAHSDPAGSTCTTSISGGADCIATKYDGMGKVWTVSNPYSTTSDPTYGLTTYTYDALGRLNDEGSTKSIVYPDGSATSTVNSNNATTITDPAGIMREVWTDTLGRAVQVSENTAQYLTYYSYDPLDDLTTVNQGAQTRTFGYDSLRRLTSASNPESGLATYTYSTSNGSGSCSGDPSDVCTRTDARGVTTCYGLWTGSSCNYSPPYGYDPLNRVSMKSYSDGTTPTANFFYDETSVTLGGGAYHNPSLNNPLGRLTHTTTTLGSGTPTATVHSYDPMGRTQVLYQCAPANCFNMPYASYDYDLAGDVVQWHHPVGFWIYNTISPAREITQVTSMVNDAHDPANLATITYTPFGAVSTLQTGCVGSGCTPEQESFFYNTRLQPAMIELGAAGNQSADSCRVYSYYKNQTPSGCSETAWPQGTTNNGNVMGYFYNDIMEEKFCHTATYQYDPLNRLQSASASPVGAGTWQYAQTYSYTGDGSGQYGNMSCTPAGPGCMDFTYVQPNPNNHINYFTVNNLPTYYTYDLAGNVIGDGTYTYTWDAEGRLTQAVSGGVAFSTNTYNALGQRVQEVANGNGVQNTTYEAYGADGALLWRYTGVSNDPSQRAFVPLPGGALAEYYGTTTNTTSTGMAFDYPDALGSLVTSVLYSGHGNACNDRLYYPFGEFWTGVGNCGWGITGTDNTYSGNMHQTFGRLPDYDPEIDLYNTLSRHYNGNSGRWMSPDPEGAAAAKLSDPQTWNMYAYATNDPTTATDPTGLDFHLTGCGATNTTNCQNNVVGAYDSNGNFTATLISNGANGGLVDQYGNQYNATVTGAGVYFGLAGSDQSSLGVFVNGTDPTTIQGSGLLSGFTFGFTKSSVGSGITAGGTFNYNGTYGQAEAALRIAGYFNYGWDAIDFFHPSTPEHGTVDFRSPGAPGSGAGSGHFAVHEPWMMAPEVRNFIPLPANAPTSGDVHLGEHNPYTGGLRSHVVEVIGHLLGLD
jgi:RHS repeat-associated protein